MVLPQQTWTRVATPMRMSTPPLMYSVTSVASPPPVKYAVAHHTSRLHRISCVSSTSSLLSTTNLASLDTSRITRLSVTVPPRDERPRLSVAPVWVDAKPVAQTARGTKDLKAKDVKDQENSAPEPVKMLPPPKAHGAQGLSVSRSARHLRESSMRVMQELSLQA